MADIPTPDLKVLWVKCGNQCAICKAPLTHVGVSSELPIGEMAHIAGEKPGSARYDENMSKSERDGYGNRMLLCPTCHTKIDKDEASYTVARLTTYKSEHEAHIEKSIKEGTLEVTFFELEDTLRHLVENPVNSDEETLQLIPTADKIKKNMLSSRIEKLLQVGLLQSRQVEDFLNKNTDMNYAQKIRGAFVAHYRELKNEVEVGDDLFFAMLDMAANGKADVKYMAAGLSVLAYYFQLCEVFEK